MKTQKLERLEAGLKAHMAAHNPSDPNVNAKIAACDICGDFFAHITTEREKEADRDYRRRHRQASMGERQA